jgi:hypothetical protein
MDHLYAEKPLPVLKHPPNKGTRLHRYLFTRQLASFGLLGSDIFRYARWMLLRDHGPRGAWKRAYDTFEKLRPRLDAGEMVVLGLVYVSARETLILWENHQVLAYGYRQTSPDSFEIAIYDPNFPRNDSAMIVAERVIVGKQTLPDGRKEPVYGLRCKEQAEGTPGKKVRGFFLVRYSPRRPPEGLE